MTDAANLGIILHPTIEQTILLAARLHGTQRDKAGVPYIAHPLAVMRMVPERSWHVAVLHDTMEDCGVTPGRLASFGYSEEEIAAVTILTRRRAAGRLCGACGVVHPAGELTGWQTINGACGAPPRDEKYEDFIERIATSGSVMAIEVKIADLLDNLAGPPYRNGVGRRDSDLLVLSVEERYQRALRRLRLARRGDVSASMAVADESSEIRGEQDTSCRHGDRRIDRRRLLHVRLVLRVFRGDAERDHGVPRQAGRADTPCVALLNDFMADHVEARIVISSTWRYSHTLRGIRAKLEEHGFHFSDRIIGTTRVNQKRTGTLYVGETRGQEIDEWLRTHYPPECRPLWIIVLDDDKDVKPFGSYHVRPQFESGLTQQNLSEMERMVEWQLAGKDSRSRA